MLDLTTAAARSDRDALADRTDVLRRVHALDALPEATHITTDLVAGFYGVDIEAVRKLVQRNRDELAADGYRLMSRAEFAEDNVSSANLHVRARMFGVFPLRAVLRVGMLLRDSSVAQQVRTLLLDERQAIRAASPFDTMRMMIDQLEVAERAAAEAKALSQRNEARIDAIEGRHDWLSALAFARIYGLNTSSQHLQRLGKHASMIAKANGVEPVKVPHALYGTVNSYPEWVWKLVAQ